MPRTVERRRATPDAARETERSGGRVDGERGQAGEGGTWEPSMARIVAYPREAVLTPEEVADWLQVSVRLVMLWPLKRLQLGERTTRFKAGDVYDFLEGRAG